MSDRRRRAFEAYQAGDFKSAEAGYRQVLAQNPSDMDSLMTLGVVLRRLGQLEEAIEVLEKTTAAVPGDFRAHANLGLAL